MRTLQTNIFYLGTELHFIGVSPPPLLEYWDDENDNNNRRSNKLLLLRYIKDTIMTHLKAFFWRD
jgi:hypothetical protein